MGKIYSEKLDFHTVMFQAMINYLNLTNDIDLMDERDCSLTNIWAIAEYFAKGKENGKQFDFTKEYEKILNERGETKEKIGRMRLDAKRFGMVIKVLGKNKLLFKGVEEEEMGEFKEEGVMDD